jgi:hypothetical protein
MDEVTPPLIADPTLDKPRVPQHTSTHNKLFGLADREWRLP